MSKLLWQDNLLRCQESGSFHVFFLHGNISDIYHGEGGTLSSLVPHVQSKLPDFEVVIKYSLSNGFSFESAEQFKKFKAAADHHPCPPFSSEEHPVSTDSSASRKGREKAMGSYQLLAEFLPTIHKVMCNTDGIRLMLLVENLDLIIPAMDNSPLQGHFATTYELLTKLANDLSIQSSRSVVLMTASEESKVNSNLLTQQNYIKSISIPLPSRSDIKNLVVQVEKTQTVKFSPNRDSVIDSCRGLSLKEVYSAISECTINGISVDTKSLALKQKEAINKITKGLLSLESTKEKFSDLGGLEIVKERLEEVVHLIKNKPGLCPKGMLFLGPPGTGKTAVAKSLANESGVNFATLKGIRSKWVGESERNLDIVCDVIQSFTPIIIFMDELDQGEGSRGGSGDGGVDKRLFAKLLSFISDDTHRGKIVWIGASNRPDLIDSALKRSGRMEDKLYFPKPSKKTLQQVVDSILLREGYEPISGLDIQDGLTGADLVYIVNNAMQQASIKELQLSREEIQLSLDNYIPQYSNEEIDFMDKVAIKEINNKRYLSSQQLDRRELIE